MRKLIVCGVGLVAVLALTVPGAFGGAAQTPGVTAKSITIGGTFPLTGPAATYAPIPVGMKAYFAYINARRGPDGKRGVMGRQIIWKYYDDGYNTAQTAQLTRRLVEQDKVFATVGQLGTEPVLASRAYINQQKVPQALVFTGASYWGLQYKEYPWTTGWQPDYIAEGRLYGLARQGEPPWQEDRDRVPERRLRQGLPVRLPGCAREAVRRRQRRRPRAGRDDGNLGRGSDDPGAREWRADPHGVPAPEAERDDDRDGQGARRQP